MTSSMLSSDRRPASTRKSGMTVLGKVPKPINLPSQRLENQGNDPNVEIVPKGTLTWGSRPCSTVPNAWGTSSISSPNADGSLSSPSGTRPSTAGSDRSHEPSNAWGPNPHPSSASGVLTSGQFSALSSRPRSAETRSGSSQLSRFADSSADNPVALVSPGIAERSGVESSKSSGFNLSSGDFPTLHSDKNSDTNSQRGHSSQGRPLSSQGRRLSSQNRPTSASGPESRRDDFLDTNITGDKNVNGPNHGTVNSWKADNPHYAHQGPPPNMDHWHRDSHQPPPYPNMNIPPHYNSWHNPQFHQGPADGSWYNRGGPPGGPYRPPSPPGGPYRPPSPPGSYSIDYPPGPPGPPRPLFYEPYPRPYLPPEQYRGPSHSDIRPGAYPRPMPHEGFYGPPRPNFYSPADREASVMGMAPPPVVHNQYPPQNQNFNPANFHGRPSGYGTCVMNNEQRKPDHLHDSQGKYRVLLKQNDGPEDKKRDWGSRSQLQETMDFDSQSRDNTVRNTAIESSKAADGLLKNPEAASVNSREIQQYPLIKKNPTLLEKVEHLNNKARTSDSQISFTEKPNAESIANPKELNVFTEDKKQESSNYRKVGENTDFVDQKKAHVTRSADYFYKEKSNRHEINEEWTKKVPESESSVNTTVISSKSGSLESDSASVDQIEDPSAQRAKMREVAIQRAKQLHQEEEERTREQKAKALAKLEELNRRTLTENSTSKSSQSSSQSIGVQNIVKEEALASATLSSDATSGEATSATSAEKTETIKLVNEDNTKKSSHSTDTSLNVEAKAKQSNIQSTSSGFKTNAAPVIASITIGTIEIQPNQMTEEKQLSYRKKQSSQKEMVIHAPTIDATPRKKDLLVQDQKNNNESSKNSKKADAPNSNLISPPQTESSKSASIPSEGLNKIQTTEVTGKVNSHSKSQAQRKVGRNQHANINNKQATKYHASDAVMWAPVKPQIKNEASSQGGDNNTVSESAKQSEKSGSHVLNGSKAKRAEMERYVPKPVAKELSQQVNSSQISQDVEKGDNFKHGKHAKTNNAWRQRIPTESDPMNNVQISNSENDGGNNNTDSVLPRECSNSTVAPKSNTTNKQRRQAYKANKAHVGTYAVSDPHATSDISEQKTHVPSENLNASVEHIKSHWQPKAQVKQNDTLQGTVEVQKENTPWSQKTVVAEARESSQNQESRRERKTPDFSNSNAGYNHEQRGRVQRGHNPNYRNQEDGERNFQANDGNKRINNSNISHVEYQQTGLNDKHEESFEGRKFGDGSRGPGSRYRGRGRNYQRGGGNFYARSMGISTRVGNDN